MKSIKNLMLLATLLALPFSFTSCDDILGEWSKPVPNPVTPSDGGEGDVFVLLFTLGELPGSPFPGCHLGSF